MAGSLTISGLAAGLVSGQKIIGPNTMVGSATVGQVTDYTLTTGDNTFTVPTGAYAVAVFLPSTNSSAITVRTNLDSGDTGLAVNPVGPWFVWPFASGTTSLILHAAAGGAVIELSFI
jgi:hypothetical protein